MMGPVDGACRSDRVEAPVRVGEHMATNRESIEGGEGGDVWCSVRGAPARDGGALEYGAR